MLKPSFIRCYIICMTVSLEHLSALINCFSSEIIWKLRGSDNFRGNWTGLIRLNLLNALMLGGNKSSHTPNQTSSFWLRVCISMYVLFLALIMKGLIAKWSSQTLPLICSWKTMMENFEIQSKLLKIMTKPLINTEKGIHF